jgi:23S rRNA (pseudouridine1915-N3)-methyltransferase
MQVIIAAVGRGKRKAEAELVQHYLKQTRWDVVVKEIPDAPSNLSADARRAREAVAFEALLGPGSRLIALDSTGKQLTSPQFATLIRDAQTHAIKHAVFAIGGQDGLDAALLKRAHAVVAFGAATWPHQLLRAMLAEQIYRAYTITIGHPYHLGH